MSKENNQNQDRTQAYDQPEFNPNDTEFAQENANFANPLATNNIEAQNSEDAEFAQEHGLSGAPEGTKDARGGNNNPRGRKRLHKWTGRRQRAQRGRPTPGRREPHTPK
jgi:hypothetical protein